MAARHLRVSAIQEDGHQVNTDVDGFDKDRLAKLSHRTNRCVQAQHYQVSEEALADLIRKQKKNQPPTRLFISFCCTCGARARNDLKLIKPHKTSDVVRCETCIVRHIETFPARYCIYCGRNIDPHESRQTICPTCSAVPASQRSTRLPK